MGEYFPKNLHEASMMVKILKGEIHCAEEEISPEYSNLSYDSHKEVLDKLFIKESNIISINDINQNDNDAIMDI